MKDHAWVLLLAPLLITPVAQARQPNIVLVFMDNFSWSEIGAYSGGILRGAPTSWRNRPRSGIISGRLLFNNNPLRGEQR